MNRVLKVRPGSFTPPPKVESVVLRFVPHTPGRGPEDRGAFLQFLKGCFSHRRKKLRNILGELLDVETAKDWDRLGELSGVDFGMRPGGALARKLVRPLRSLPARERASMRTLTRIAGVSLCIALHFCGALRRAPPPLKAIRRPPARLGTREQPLGSRRSADAGGLGEGLGGLDGPRRTRRPPTRRRSRSTASSPTSTSRSKATISASPSAAG